MKVLVGAFEYKVKGVTRLDDSQGFCETDKGEVYYSKAQDVAHRSETVLHELLHCIFDQTSERNRSKDEQEATITNISPLLFQVLRDNPRLVEFLLP